MSARQRGLQLEAAGFVLAGGQSSRMGRDKALIQLAGQPLVLRALDILRELGLPASIAGARPSLAAFAPMVEDAGQGPLGGVCAALATCAARRAVFLPVDQPMLPSSALAYLLYHAELIGSAITIFKVNGVLQTFPAVVDRAVLPGLESRFRDGHGGCLAAFQMAAAGLGRPLRALPVELLVQAGQVADDDYLPAALWFLNMNAPSDLVRAQRLLPEPHGVS